MTTYNKLLGNVLVPLAAGMLATACSSSFTQKGERSDSQPDERNIPVVEAVQTRFGSVQLSERLSGTVIAKNKVALYSEISGKIARVEARNGDFVREGDPLVFLQDAQYREQLRQARANHRVNQAALKQAQAQLEELQAQYRAKKTLADEGLASQLEVETLEAQIASARASIELAEAQIQQSQSAIEEANTILSRTVIRAPITGTVGGRNAEVGMQVDSNAQLQLFTIGDLDQLRVEVILTEEVLDSLRLGQPVRIYARSDTGRPRVLQARLSRISPFLDPVTRTTQGEMDVRNEGNILRPGMSVTVDILYVRSQQATLVPTSAIYTNPNTGQVGVYVMPSFDPGLDSEVKPAQHPGSSNHPPISLPTQVEFRPVDVIGEGRMEVAVRRIEPGNWIVAVGQDLLSGGAGQARVRVSSWERILGLQGLQREDLLREVLETE